MGSLERTLRSRLDTPDIDRVVVGAVIVANDRVLLLRRRGGDFLEGLWELLNLVVQPSHSPVLLSEHDAFGWFTLEEMGWLNVSEETAACVTLGVDISTLGTG